MRVATRVAVFLSSLMTWTSCGLNTAGIGDDENSAPDIVPDEIMSDVSEVIDNEVTEENSDREESGDAYEVEPDEGMLEDESTDSLDAEEDFSEVEDSEEDGETVDPCAPPDIPTTGIWLFFCLTADARTDMTMWRWVDRDELPDIEWSQESGCTVRNSRILFCDLSLYSAWRPATVHFNIAMRGSLWSCEGFDTPYGQPRVWIDGLEIMLGMAPGAPPGSSNHTFRLLPLQLNAVCR